MASSYRQKCIEEKGEKCQLCGSIEEVEVHHVDGDRSNNSLDNLIPVCNECHRDIHLNRAGKSSWYQKLEHDKGWGGIGGPDFETIRTTTSFGEKAGERIEEFADEHSVSHAKAVRHFVRKGISDQRASEQNAYLRDELESVVVELEEKKQRVERLGERVENLEDRIEMKDARIDKLIEAITGC